MQIIFGKKLISHQNIIFLLTTLLLLPLHHLLFLLDDTIGDTTNSLYYHDMNQHLLWMIEALFGELNACVQVIHAYTMMQRRNTIKKDEDTGVKRIESLVDPLF